MILYVKILLIYYWSPLIAGRCKASLSVALVPASSPRRMLKNLSEEAARFRQSQEGLKRFGHNGSRCEGVTNRKSSFESILRSSNKR